MNFILNCEQKATDIFKEIKNANQINEDLYNKLHPVGSQAGVLQLAMKEWFFIFDKTFYKQLDGLAMGSPLGSTLTNSFLCYHEKRWLYKCPQEFKPMFYRQYVDDIFLLVRKEEHFKLFLNYFNSCHENIKFTSEKETNKKLSFVNIEISRDKNQFITSVYCKPTFSGVFSHFDSFI